MLISFNAPQYNIQTHYEQFVIELDSGGIREIAHFIPKVPITRLIAENS